MSRIEGVRAKAVQWVLGFLFLCALAIAALAPKGAGAVLNPPPGGPILVITSPTSTFGQFYGEILRNEGLNEFAMGDIGSVTAATLASYDVVVLAKATLTPAQVTMFTNWVKGGGNLIAMAPDAQLAPLLGLTATGTTLPEGYLLINTATAPGAGLVNQTIQYHGSADRYTLTGATSVATLYSNATTATANPAVTLRASGSGTASAFTFDLATSVVYTRQGNPAWAGQERDGSSPIRPDDLFFGNAAGDAKPDWIDLGKVVIPQADEQQRLLANLILHVNQAKKPLPRFWYFPQGKKAVVIMTGDDHGNGGTAGRFEQFKTASPAGCSVADWDCVRGTAYIYTNTPLTAAQAAAYTAEGFEIGLHINPGCTDFDAASLQSIYTAQLAEWQAKYDNLPAPSTQRHHCAVWSDWATAARTQLKHGMRLDTTYQFGSPGWASGMPGLFTGSAMPMRFSALDGSLIDVFQAPTVLSDESGPSYPAMVDKLLDRAIGLEGYYGAFAFNVQADIADSPEAAAVVASARARGVAVVSARQMLNWLDARNASSFESLAWNGNTLTFNLSAGAGATGLQAMLPLRVGDKRLQSLTRAGGAVRFTLRTLKGIDYALFPGIGGAYAADYRAELTTAPSAKSAIGTAGAGSAAAPVSTLALPGPLLLEAASTGWPATAVPTNPSVNDPGPLEVGVKFRTDVDGQVTGVRFYKGTNNTGTHVGSVWSSSGQRLATATFTNETATGWQQVTFATPLAVTANTVYVASYFAPNGGYAGDNFYFTNNGVDNGSLHLLQDGVSGGNGVYVYAGASSFPTQSFRSTNYWVDVVFEGGGAPDTTPPTVTSTTPASGSTAVAVTSTVRAVFSEAIDPATVGGSTFELRNAANAVVASTVTYDAATRTATLAPSSSLATSSSYTATVRGGTTDPRIKDLAGNALASSVSWSFTTNSQSSGCPCSAWPPTATPANPSLADTVAVELGVKFRTDVSGYVTGIRFFKGAGNTGTHSGSLWTSGGQLLATAQFINETATGWQQVNFGAAVPISANTVYVASYFAPSGGYAGDNNYFANAGVDNGLVHLLQNGVSGGNGVFVYGASGGFPAQTFAATNYWVDVVFATVAPVDNVPPSVASTTPANTATGVGITSAVRAVFNEPLDPATVSGATFELRNASNTVVAATVSYDVASRTVNLAPGAALALSSTYTATLRGGSTDPRIKDLAGNALAANVTWSFTTEATSACAAPANSVVAENCLTGNPPSEWDVVGSGDSSIQGYATQISVNRGSTVSFKVETNAAAYRFDIYRIGYYGGAGARKVATVLPSATLPQTQPSCLNDSVTGLVDCGNWAVSGSWVVPTTAVSGVYLAKLVRTDTGGTSHIYFIVRDDAGNSDLLFKTSDTTWQAYNDYGGNSLYSGSPAGRAYKVSYNRPFVTRGNQYSRAFFFGGEYPMVRWIEANGYNVSYMAGVDVERSPALIANHSVLLSVGHDEYWSAGQRTSIEGARDSGVHLAFFSGNEMFWKTRWENSIDGSATAYRTLASYKETHANAKIDPTAIWTGTWRDPRFSPPADGGRPENAVTGTIFTVNCCAGAESGIQVPAEYGNLRFWRNTSIATLPSGQVATLPAATLGYEWDEDLDNGFRPAGLFRMSSTAVSGVSYLQDYGSTYATGTATHSLTMHKRSNGARVFGAGTIRWSWGLDGNHDFDSATPNASTTPDVRMQQATVNLFADMNAQPGSLRPGLVAATASTDLTPPGSVITAPAGGATLAQGVPTTISGTATDVGGVVAGVEVSIDGGTTWRRANGRSSWTYSWTPTVGGAVTIRSRSVDDSGNIQSSVTSVSVTIGGVDTTPPTVTARSPAVGATGVAPTANVTVTFGEAMNAATIGASTFELRDAANALVAATVTYDAATSTATLNPTATLVAGATYTATVRGGATDPRVKDLAGNALQSNATWSFTTATAGDTTPPTITARSPAVGATGVAPTANVTVTFSEAMDAATISASTIELRDTASALVAATVSYDTATSTATLDPTATLVAGATYTATVRGGTTDPRVKDLAGNALQANATWSFTTATAGDTTPPTITARSPAVGATGVAQSANVTVTFSEAMDTATISALTIELRDAANALVAAAVSYDAATRVATLDPTPTLAAQDVYSVRVRGGTIDPRVKDVAGNALGADSTWTFTTEAAPSCPCTIWPATATPLLDSASDSASVNLGVKFRSDVAGYITGIRFFKGTANTGTHVGTLWSSGGQQLAQATFTSETGSGWQQVSFAAPVAIAANTTYVASYLAPVGRYAFNGSYFSAGGVDNAPLHALSDSAGAGNGVYVYASGSLFPSLSFNASNYWVDVVFTTSVTDTTPPTVTARSPAVGATGVAPTANVTVTFSEAMDAATISGTTFELRDAGNVLVGAVVSYNSTTRIATLNPTPTLAALAVYSVRVRGGAAGVKDVSGNALAADATWTFTTVADTTPPTVSSITPASGALAVSRSTTVRATFSEDMNATTITTTSFTLVRNSTGVQVTAALTYDPVTRIATLTPSSALAASATYTATVRGGTTDPRVKDVAGNALATSRVWSFTTGL